ncbi:MULTISPECIES: ABC transporter ATP-binding protein [Pandoraea]|uniref:ABC transporter ATP-binding protein n=1 Tax=Pandoraea TaxID=93217 RepID=UPI001F5E001B|nr:MULTISPECIES: ABC transporter ATP-binding protein [Pandoraea]MCI3204267.1 histidinol phosphatase [Pandoraea sp. LA3]MDN4582293.1 histidinol phosphatase [Pandoraea capi]
MPGELHIAQLSWSPADLLRPGAAPLLQSITLDVARGEFVGLIGPNGSGKSSLLRCAFRYAKPQTGAVTLDGTNVWHVSPRWSAQHIAVLLQELPDDFGLSVEQVVWMGRTPHKRLLDADTPDDAALVARALRDVDMTAARERAFATLSGGEKQRVLLARALAQEPDVLMLDEPTSFLDLHHQVELMRRIRSLNVTTLATIHDLNLAAAYCDRLYVLAGGEIVAHGAPDDVLTVDLLARVFQVEALVDRHPVTHRPRITLVHPLCPQL